MLASIAGLCLAGCASNRSATAPVDAMTGQVTRPLAVQTGTAGYSVQGRPIAYEVLGDGPETVLVIASIHGDEPAGTPLIRRLRAEVLARPGYLQGRTLVLVPVANPDGLARGRRRNARGVDLNRDFPAENRRRTASAGPSAAGAEPQPETRALLDLAQLHAPDRIISLHQPAACVDYDGPAERLAREVAAACDLPVRKLGARPGSLGSWAGVDRGIPVLTLELPGSASRLDDDALWSRYGAMMLAAIRK